MIMKRNERGTAVVAATSLLMKIFFLEKQSSHSITDQDGKA